MSSSISKLPRTQKIKKQSTYRSNDEMEGGSAMNSNSGGGSVGITSSGNILACSRGFTADKPNPRPFRI